MPSILQALLDLLESQASVISNAWPTLLTAAFIIGLVEWAILKTFKAREIDNLKGARDAAIARLDLAKDQGKIAESKTTELEKRIDEIKTQTDVTKADVAELKLLAAQVRTANTAVSSALSFAVAVPVQSSVSISALPIYGSEKEKPKR